MENASKLSHVDELVPRTKMFCCLNLQDGDDGDVQSLGMAAAASGR